MGLTFWKGEVGGLEVKAKITEQRLYDSKGYYQHCLFKLKIPQTILDTNYHKLFTYVRSQKLVPANNSTLKVRISFCIVNQAKNHH